MKFQPSFFLKNCHIQTLYSTFFTKVAPIEFKTELFTLPDGDFLDIYYNRALLPQDAQSITVLFHGLAGSYKSPYIQRMIYALQEQSIAAVVMHYRSSSGRDNKKPQTYHSGKTDDPLLFLKYLHKKYPYKKLFCIGYSLGGNMLLKLLGELQDKSFINAAVAVSAPMDLAVCADVMNKGASKFYQEYLLKDLRRSLERKYAKHDMQRLIGLEKKEIKKLKSFWKFDDAYTAKINGFGTAKNYYKQNSAKQYLRHITTPTLIIHAKDDPFMDVRVIPSQEEISPMTALEVLENGGHVGFIAGTLLHPKYWLEKRILSYLKQF